MEQVNQEIKAYLRVFVSHCQDDWADWLPLAEFAYNNHIHSTTHHTPFKLDSGQHPQMGSEPTWSSAVEAADNFAQQMSQMQDKAKAALKHATDKMAWYYDHQRSPTPAYEVGAKIWLNAQNYMTTHCRRDNCPLYELPTESGLGVQSILKSLTLIQHSFDIQNPMWNLVGLKLRISEVLQTLSYLSQKIHLILVVTTVVLPSLYVLWGTRSGTCRVFVYILLREIPWEYLAVLYIVEKVF